MKKMADPIKYPNHLNPFGDDDDTNVGDDYPDHLDPFEANDDETNHDQTRNQNKSTTRTEDYDDSLNPFGDTEQDGLESRIDETSNSTSVERKPRNDEPTTNPFEDDDEHQQIENDPPKSIDAKTIIRNGGCDDSNRISLTPQPQSLESSEPPKPLPRTKSLLKKELAMKRRQQEQQETKNQSSQEDLAHNLAPKTTIATESVGSFQRKKNKRVAPPVPVNFKRQVCGSLEAIEDELNAIGDQLSLIEKESILCQEKLKAPGAPHEDDFPKTKDRFIELLKKKNSISRRQKELMYKKRELKLDQIHSDIEYELRMIGNKQMSTRTAEDEAKEKELLKKLVEIVEEKSDIIENLNRDTTCDNRDIEEAFSRLNLSEHVPDKGLSVTSTPPPLPPSPPKFTSRKENCDKISLNKFGKFATLLPKSNTIKGNIKIKRRHLFKKRSDSPQTPPMQNDKHRAET